MPRRLRQSLRGAVAVIAVAGLAAPAVAASVPRTRVSTDHYSGPGTGRHATEVEPDSFAAGRRIVAAFQVGRFESGGGINIGWATSADGGVTWTEGVMPGLTVAEGGTAAAVTDPAVAYDRKHGVWLVASIPLDAEPIKGRSVVVNRSLDGGLTWKGPVTVATAGAASDFDKDWVVCDTWPSSPHYGNCYAEWDDYQQGLRVLMSTSKDGGKTWGAPKAAADGATGLGGQPVVRPNGTVVVPYTTPQEDAIRSIRSTNGGASWSASVGVGAVAHTPPYGNMRSGPLPSAEVDHAGRVYVAWEDCRFSGCIANDIVLTSSGEGVHWADVKRVPIHATSRGIDHFVPGLGVDRRTSGPRTHLALAYHYIDNEPCSSSTCNVRIGFVDSLDGGRRWSRPRDLSGRMLPEWMAHTADGFMTGDYISTSFSTGKPRPVFAVARPPSGGRLDEAIYASRPSMLRPPGRKLSELAVDPFSFRARDSGGPVVAKGGGRVSYRASAAGETSFAVERRVRREGAECGGGGGTCYTWVRRDGRFSHADRKGGNSFHFSGRLRGHRLHAGQYRLVARPQDPDREPATAARARFKILPQRQSR